MSGGLSEVAADEHLRLASALGAARSVAIRGLSVTIDGRCLTAETSGTAVATLELIAALDAHTDVRLRVVVALRDRPYARDVLGARPADRDPGLRARWPARSSRTDVAHRPYQVGAAEDMRLLSRARPAHRRHPARHHRLPQPGVLRGIRQVAGVPQAGGRDRSPAPIRSCTSARPPPADARALDLAPPDADARHPARRRAGAGRAGPRAGAPDAIDRIGDGPFLLCLGTDFLHKNRLFAIRLLEELVSSHGFDGALVFAGPKVTIRILGRRGGRVPDRPPRAGGARRRPRRSRGGGEAMATVARGRRRVSDHLRGVRAHPVRGSACRHAVSVRLAHVAGRVPAGERGLDRPVGHRRDRGARRPGARPRSRSATGSSPASRRRRRS